MNERKRQAYRLCTGSGEGETGSNDATSYEGVFHIDGHGISGSIKDRHPSIALALFGIGISQLQLG